MGFISEKLQFMKGVNISIQQSKRNLSELILLGNISETKKKSWELNFSVIDKIVDGQTLIYYM